MARPIKEGLDYFPFDVDFFSDKKIKRLRAKYGNDGIVVYLYLLCLIYRDKGYYVEYDEDLILDISDELRLTESSTRQILKYLISRSLLCEIRDSTLAPPVTIISAKSVQRRFQAAKKSGKRDVFVTAGRWLLEKSETLGCIKVRSSESLSKNNDSFSKKNDQYSEKKDIKESKVKKSKVNESESALPSSRTCPPTLDEVSSYVAEKGYRFSAERFVNYYGAKNWRIRGDRITDWRRLADNWGMRDSGSGSGNGSGTEGRASSFDVNELEGLSMFSD